MSSFKEIVFVVQKTQFQALGFEQVALELSKALGKHYTCNLKTIPAPTVASSFRLYKLFLQFFYSVKHFLLCLKYATQGDVIYFFGKKSSLCFPIIKLLSTKKILSQVQYLPVRLSGKRGIARLWERFEERLTFHFADRVFVDSARAQAYFKEEYKRKPAMTFYGADHFDSLEDKTPQKLFNNNRKYAIAYMPKSPRQALMALKSFAQYPKYDYYLILDTDKSSLPAEISKFEAYDHIHLCEKNQDTIELFSQAFLYFHLEPSVSARLRLLEAMKAGKFTLCFDTVFSRRLTRNEALYFSNHSQLISCLHRAVTQSHFDQGNRMKVLAEKLSWGAVADGINQHIVEVHQQEVPSLMLERSKVDV